MKLLPQYSLSPIYILGEFHIIWRYISSRTSCLGFLPFMRVQTPWKIQHLERLALDVGLEISGGGSCYPRYLGINRRSCLEVHMVLDMKYREQELPEYGPGGPFFFFSARFVLPAVPASITNGLGLHQRRLLLHEVIGPRYHGMCHI